MTRGSKHSFLFFLHHWLLASICTMNSLICNQWPGAGPEGKITMRGCEDHYDIIALLIKMTSVRMWAAELRGRWGPGLWSALITARAEWFLWLRQCLYRGAPTQTWVLVILDPFRTVTNDLCLPAEYQESMMIIWRYTSSNKSFHISLCSHYEKIDS